MLFLIKALLEVQERMALLQSINHCALHSKNGEDSTPHAVDIDTSPARCIKMAFLGGMQCWKKKNRR